MIGRTSPLAALQATVAAVLVWPATAAEPDNVLAAVTVIEEIVLPAPPASLRTDTPLLDVPQAVTVIERDLIDAQAMQGLADVLRNVPGVGLAQGEGNRETPVFRGSSSTSDFFLDGLRDDVAYYRDLYNIERVEVLSGPNGLLFGRGGAGGVLNRITKQAGSQLRQLALQAGSYSQRRITVDIGEVITPQVALRVNAVGETSGSYRDGVTLLRHGLAPVIALTPGSRTSLAAGLEYFHDERVADRGVPAFAGRALDLDRGQFFGDPARSRTHSTVYAATLAMDHRLAGTFALRNRSRLAYYDKFYQNVYPGAVDGTGSTVAISAYNNATARENLLNQTDLVGTVDAGGLRHQLLAGIEMGRQRTTNRRNTGYFTAVSPTTTSLQLPLSNPLTTSPLQFRPSATDADNHSTAAFAALLLQDQLSVGERVDVLLGARYERLTVDFRNHRNATQLAVDDQLLSPRAGLVLRPAPGLSTYASYSLSLQPRAGEQLGALTPGNAALAPERHVNLELGLKWSATPELTVTAALYRLQRHNVAITDPNDSTRLQLVDGQRVGGLELSAAGRIATHWNLQAAYAYQQGELVSDQSSSARAGARLAALPRHSGSVWNHYTLSTPLSVGLGLSYRSGMYAALQNTVAAGTNVWLPGYLRVDAALFYRPGEAWRLQANVENLLDRRYAASANSNTNITPGAPRSMRLTLSRQF